MKKLIEESKIGKCKFCDPQASPKLCDLSTAKTKVDGKEYSACCVKCSDETSEEKPKRAFRTKL